MKWRQDYCRFPIDDDRAILIRCAAVEIGYSYNNMQFLQIRKKGRPQIKLPVVHSGEIWELAVAVLGASPVFCRFICFKCAFLLPPPLYEVKLSQESSVQKEFFRLRAETLPHRPV
jgi:hypothetical protein